MNEQSKAERIASELDSIEATPITCGVIHEAAFELRRLHAENTEIRMLNDDLFYQGLAVINEKQELLDAAVKAEREACAKVAEEATGAWTEYEFNSGCMYCAKAIRARGEQEKPR